MGDPTHNKQSQISTKQLIGYFERTVQTVKNVLKKSKGQDIHLALLNNRTSPLINLPSPAEMLMGRKLRGRLPEAKSRLQTKASKLASQTFIDRQQKHKNITEGIGFHNSQWATTCS
ncbi:Pol polyprotein [Plakobranchus ocellatus]|uniref:Pol polyprotein n=1 Tax=Plakobranchus ocellatus TaxID=259542 RepID=A0AAV4B6G0_9GAST|nr:Pol polyprotein [Plakobranchus ocellatus]